MHDKLMYIPYDFLKSLYSISLEPINHSSIIFKPTNGHKTLGTSVFCIPMYPLALKYSSKIGNFKTFFCSKEWKRYINKFISS